MFKIGDKWMLLCISHHFGCRYYLGDFKDGKYLPESHTLMNWITTDNKGEEGLVYFAPESMVTEDGRSFLGEINLRGGLRGARISADDYQRRIRSIEKSCCDKAAAERT